jgi:hypothetical protein
LKGFADPGCPGSIWWGSHCGEEGSMKFLRGMYPRLALVAVLVSLAIASGAAKKWA